MIENINDVFSLVVVIIILTLTIIFALRVFIKKHSKKLLDFENEYYDHETEETSDETYI